MKKAGNKAFTLIEILCVLAVLAILAAISIPRLSVLFQDSKEATTIASTRAAAGTVEGCMALFDKAHCFAPRNSGGSYDYSDATMNNYLEKIFENGVETENAYSYVNQVSNSTAILNWSSPISGAGANPAVFLTNTSAYSYENSTAAAMRLLRGSIVIYFATEGTGSGLTTTQIEVYYTDEDGVKCNTPYIITT